MIVKKMTANFGVLSHAELRLDPGLNVIELPNESGKSTWCAFMRVMLFGPAQGRQKKTGERTDRSYAPWDGSAMSGEIELITGGEHITLRRFDLPSGGAMRGFSAVYTGTNQNVSGLGSADAGEVLTGMTLPVFTRTAFIGPSGIAVDQSPELEKKIGSLLSSGEESTSFSEAADRLRAAQRRIRSRGKGLLPGLEEERDRLQKTVDEISETVEKTEALEAEAESISAAIENFRRTAPRELTRTQELLTAQRKQLSMERELRERESEAELAARELRGGVLRGRAPTKETQQAMRADTRRAKELRQSRGFSSSRIIRIVLFVLSVLFAAAGIVAYRGAFALAAICLLAALGLTLPGVTGKHNGGRRDRELSALLKKYGADTPGEIPARYEEYVRSWEEASALRREAEELRTQVKQSAEKTDVLRETEEGRVPDSTQLLQLEGKLSELSSSTERLRGRLDTLGDPVLLRERMDSIDVERSRLEKRLKAIEMALNELTAADEEMNARFSPTLSRETETIFRSLTGGKYDQLTLDRDLSAAVREEGALLPHGAELLSRGARDQLYLSVRLALCDLIPSDEPCPIILDDALICFDDERMALALNYLKEISRHRQVILFTCQSREKAYLSRK